ncbi:helix-turn-helix transcriptional regulator [Dyadobacter sp. CY326]|uniref:helix-turn-helix transcriptional regulator n=1 Tax=Dyadobacter sp. CY326 TaxID=2907300 RepID=UPI001F3409CE|nr:helix-turn-helix transcriptional regulator [Dyadobacter sp. CY326]MCE7065153.1 AAA family ATPase [Dyadobacter sp. CY326]
MELIERAEFLNILRSRFRQTLSGEGHCIFVTGEPGIGKTTLVNAFCKEIRPDYKTYWGTCDALYSPRPLAPLYDIMMQLGKGVSDVHANAEDRTALFFNVLQELHKERDGVLVVFEDIHWADEATLDFIKFLGRRIGQLKCLLILTYRDDEVHTRHPLRNVLGQFYSDSFTKFQLTPFSRQIVEEMAAAKGYSGEEVYKITNGNPFYVTEILASYSSGVPENVRDSILSVYKGQEDDTKTLWEMLSIFPAGFELNYLEQIQPRYREAVKYCFGSRILIVRDRLIFFKHQLYSQTIEASLSPLLRITLNKQILSMFLDAFEQNQEIERIIHHAKNAGADELIARYAPIAAQKSASAGAHADAARLYCLAIECEKFISREKLAEYYELYAYECYLIHQHKEAIAYAERALGFWQEQQNAEKVGEGLRFLSRLWWYEGNRTQAEKLGARAVNELENAPASRAKAMAYSNMAALKMLADQTDECLMWGQKATDLAREIGDQETLAHALNSIGSALMTDHRSISEGMSCLQESLRIALKYAFHEHAARAYTAIGSNAVSMKLYDVAGEYLDLGIAYCLERDMDSLRLYMVGYKARLCLETGAWDEAYDLANGILQTEDLLPVIKTSVLITVGLLKLRRGEEGALDLLTEAKEIAFDTMELHRIVPALSALLEYEWLLGTTLVEPADLDRVVGMVKQTKKIKEDSKLYFWLQRARKDYILTEGSDNQVNNGNGLASHWEKAGCPYEYALTLFDGDEADMRKALHMIQELGAERVYQKLRQSMRSEGVRKIPRGKRLSTRSNAAQLTSRELDVLQLLQTGMQNKEIAEKLFISAKTVDHHISAILVKLDVGTRAKAVIKASGLGILK